MTTNPADTARADRPNIVLINPDRHAEHKHRDLVSALEEQHGVSNAMVVQASNPTAKWLDANHMSALSDQQRASFDNDGVVMLLQHPIDPNFTIPVVAVARAAVEAGVKRVEKEGGGAVGSAQIAAVIKRLDEMSHRDRSDFFVSAYIDMPNHEEGRGIIASFTQAELDVALSNAWATRKFIMLNGRA